ncbi:MAG: DUF29 domain-containing protein [Alphaproteobacteria bacterium]|nr:MAG: DUF29 domain-containing protein [Alphaproteobacteria bacterium]
MSDAKTLYDEDFFAWTKHQAKALRAAARSGTNQPIDWENLAEEVEDLGKSVRREMGSEIRRIIQHLLKLQYSPSADPRRGWFESITGARSEIEDILEQNPSLRRELDQHIAKQTARAIDLAIFDLERYGEIDRSTRRTLQSTSYSREQILGNWFPPEPKQPAPRAR